MLSSERVRAAPDAFSGRVTRDGGHGVLKEYNDFVLAKGRLCEGTAPCFGEKAAHPGGSVRPSLCWGEEERNKESRLILNVSTDKHGARHADINPTFR
jgi:hypothetical protein